MVYKGLIYLIKNKINESKYIGITTRSLRKRISEHKYDSTKKDKKRHHYLHRAINKYGIENFDFIVIEEIEKGTKEALWEYLCEKEKHYIDKYDTFNNGYNLTIGGDGSFGHTWSDEDKQRISNYRKGTHMSEEAKKKISLFMRSDKNTNRGRKMSDESKLKISKANKGKLAGDKNPMYGKKRLDLSERNLQGSYKICQIDIKTNQLIKIWDSLRECSRVTGWNRSCISDCCKGKAKQSHGYLWVYYSEYLKQEAC